MASRNDITGDRIATKTASDAYRSNYETIFGHKDQKQSGPASECKQCPGCDRKNCDSDEDRED
jgi:hypothetical protein